MEAEDASEALEIWKQHPMTAMAIEVFTDEAEKALKNLIGAARNTTDPNVMKWSARYETLIAAKKTIAGEK